MSKVYNTIIGVTGLVRADSPAEAERLLIQHVESLNLDLYVSRVPTGMELGTFESEDVPEEHVLKI